MIDFSAGATYGKTATTQPSPSTALLEREVGRVGHVLSAGATDLLDDPADWSWQQLRDYVLRAIDSRHGPQPPADPARTSAIFKGFHARWGDQAGPIARFAFEQQDGYWRSAPVTTARFCKGSDPYFAQPIAERLSA